MPVNKGQDYARGRSKKLIFSDAPPVLPTDIEGECGWPVREKVNRAAPTRPKPFGVRSLTTGVKEAVCGSAAARRRVKRRLRLLGCAIAERFRSDSAPPIGDW